MSNRPNRFDGKVAIITGAASEIGRRTAALFVSEGARVLLADLDTDPIAATISTLGHNAADGVTLDVRDEAAVQRLVQRAVARFGHLDVAVNAASAWTATVLEQHSLEAWDRIISTCLTGTFLSVKHEARQFVAQGRGGAIVNVAGPTSPAPGVGMAALTSAQAGISALTSIAALEFARHQIRVNCIGPRLVDGPTRGALEPGDPTANASRQQAPGSARRPVDIPAIAAFLASDEAAGINGQTVSENDARLDRHPGPLTRPDAAAAQQQ